MQACHLRCQPPCTGWALDGDCSGSGHARFTAHRLRGRVTGLPLMVYFNPPDESSTVIFKLQYPT
jgi:hypothetical protein